MKLGLAIWPSAFAAALAGYSVSALVVVGVALTVLGVAVLIAG